MWPICRVSVETIDVEFVEAPVKARGERGCGVVLTDDVNGAQDGGAWDEAEPGGDVVCIGLFGDGEGVCGVVLVIISCPSEGDAVQSAVDSVLWGDDVEKLNEGELFR